MTNHAGSRVLKAVLPILLALVSIFLIASYAASPEFHLSLEDLQGYMVPENYIGRAAEQTERFLAECIAPVLSANKELLGVKADISV